MKLGVIKVFPDDCLVTLPGYLHTLLNTYQHVGVRKNTLIR